MIFLSLSGTAEEEIEFVESLKRDAANYDWFKNGSASEISVAATHRWDSLQSLHCCGLKDYSFWNTYRPSKIQSNRFPASCCAKITEFCDIDERPWRIVSMTGCLDRVKQVEDAQSVFYFSSFLVMGVLSILSIFYVFFEKCWRCFVTK